MLDAARKSTPVPGYGQCNPITRFFLDLFPVSGYNKAVQKRVHPTMLVFDIELGFSIFADYSDWKTGNYRPIQRWRPVRSRLLRE
jgi:hypothetical protein